MAASTLLTEGETLIESTDLPRCVHAPTAAMRCLADVLQTAVFPPAWPAALLRHPAGFLTGRGRGRSPLTTSVPRIRSSSRGATSTPAPGCTFQSAFTICSALRRFVI
jgi:hypothetical protein